MTAFVLSACGANQSILESGKERSASEVSANGNSPAYDTAEAEIENMRTANFRYIYVIRRNDGDVFASAEKTLIKTETDGANRRVGAERGRAIIVGSNYPITVQKVNALRSQFAIEDLSPISDLPEANSNSNASGK